MRGRGKIAAALPIVVSVVLGGPLPAPASAAEQHAYTAAETYATPVIVASKGDTLRLENLDATAQHDLDSDRAGLFYSKLVSFGSSAKVRGVNKARPGTYAFHCSIHSWMKGELVVRQPGVATSGPEPPPPGGGAPTGPDPGDLLPLVDPAPLKGGNWPVYGHDASNSRDAGSAGPSPSEVPLLGPVWSRYSGDGDFTGTPVVGGDTLVIGSRGGTVFGLDPSSGKVRWRRDLIDNHDEDAARITAAAAIQGDHVYVPVNAIARPTIVALDLKTGAVEWRQVVDRQERADMYGSPQPYGRRIYVGTSGYFGEQLTGVKVSARGTVNALDADTGRRLWKTYTVPRGHDGGSVWSTPAVESGGDRIYVGTGNAYHRPAAKTTDSMMVLDAGNGRLLDHFQAVSGDAWNGAEDSAQNPDADFGASPSLFRLDDGTKVVGQGEKSGVYWALDRRSMKPAWSALTGPGSFQGGIIGSTAVDDGRIYGPNSIDGGVWALQRSGLPAWKSTDAAPLHFGAVSTSNGVVYANDMAGFMTARETLTGAVLAKLPLGSPSWAGVAIAGGYVFTATGSSSDSGYVVAYRPRV